METPTHNSHNNNNINNNNNITSCSFATNWTIAHGSLDTSITFESSDSPIDSEAVDSTRKSPLILKSTSPDSGPCEIKITFTQKHEVRQVYVRSTARIYEIYFAPALHSINEYLCTVRCSVAAREEELLSATDIEEALCANSKGSGGELAEVKITSENNIGTNEDDWVEVKVLDSPLLDNRKNSVSQKTDANTRSIKDFYEATAEISDADPCMSLTLRLLSLQSKGCVYVDEVYVFADPVEYADSQNQPVQVGNSAGSSFMTMLVPTLLQLSKSGIARTQDKYASDTVEKQEYLEIGPKATDSINIANEIQQDEKFRVVDQQDVKLLQVNGATAEPTQTETAMQVSDKDRNDDSFAKNDLPYCRVERVLEQLVSRVSRIEELCLRFEENMLKPVNGMEARLQRVEQQLEVLVKNSQYYGLPSCTRISAPAFSCSESNSSSIYNDGCDYPTCGASESVKKDFTSKTLLSNLPDDLSTSVTAPRFIPSLVITAPDFSCGDDEEDNDASEPSKDPPKGKRQAVSIDDALAAALTGFLSTTVHPSKYSQALLIRAPEFTNEENGNDEPSMYTPTRKVTAPEFACEENSNDDQMASPSVQNEKSVVPFNSSCETNRNECIENSVSTSNNSSSVEGEGQAICILSDGHSEEISGGVGRQDRFYEGETGFSSQDIIIDCPPLRAKQVLTKADDYQIAGEISRQESSNRISDLSVSEETDVQEQFLGNLSEDSFDTTQQGVAATEGSDKGMVPIIMPSCAVSAVDFEIPILDVKFATSESSSVKTPLDALLTDVAEFDIEAQGPSDQEGDHVEIGEQSNFAFVEDGEPNDITLMNSHLLMDLDGYDVGVSSNMEGEGLQNYHTLINQEMFESLI